AYFPPLPLLPFSSLFSFFSFSLSFVAKSKRADIKFRWLGSIVGDEQGIIRYRFQGEVLDSFYRNRIGLCVLHPAHCARLPCEITHVNDSVSAGYFPESISPHQPFQNIRAITHNAVPQWNVRIEMFGDTFEMEDQRNWTDASFKTYSTPLHIPFPVCLEKGTRIDQSVEIALCPSRDSYGLSHVSPNTAPTNKSLNESKIDMRREADTLIRIDWKAPVRRPKIGVLMPHDAMTVAEPVIQILHAIHLDHLRADLQLDQNGWQQRLAQAVLLAGQIDSQLEIAIFAETTNDLPWRECIQRLRDLRSRIARLLVFHTSEKTTPSRLLDEAVACLNDNGLELQIVSGTDAYFAELNRGRPPCVSGSCVCYSMNPQVHAFDNWSLAETLEALGATVDSAFEYFGSDVVVSPISLRPRFNPNATIQMDRATELQAAIDPRQKTGFGAAWTVGVLANLATHPRVRSLTLFEAFGPRGIVDNDSAEYPMTKVFSLIQTSQEIYPATSTLPLSVVGFATSATLVLGNLSNDQVEVDCGELQSDCGEVEPVRLVLEPESIFVIPLPVVRSNKIVI
ncbi:MAG: hypothetical protein ABL921_29470, partial [Pirellula sp.]